MGSLQILRNSMPRKAVSCPIETTLEVICGRWKVLVIDELRDGVKRFGELNKALTGMSHRTLTKQIRELEAAGLLRRKDRLGLPDCDGE